MHTGITDYNIILSYIYILSSYNMSSLSRTMRCLRRATTTTTTSSAPFEGQSASATQRHREARRQQMNEKEAGKHVMDAAGFSQTLQASATHLHRLKRKEALENDRVEAKTSHAAAMSATNKYRLTRANTRTTPAHLVVSSDISFWEGHGSKGKAAASVEGKKEVLGTPSRSRLPIFLVGGTVLGGGVAVLLWQNGIVISDFLQ